MPYTRQAAFGWSHQLSSSTMFSADFVRNDGRDPNVRPRINTRPVGQPTAPATPGLPRPAAKRRRHASRSQPGQRASIRRSSWASGAGCPGGSISSASYTLAEAKSTIGTAADELNSINLQEAELLYDDPRVFGPTSRTDARHTVSATMRLAGAVGHHRGAAFPRTARRSRRPLPRASIATATARTTTCPPKAYAFDGVGNAPKEIGNCETWNCGRGASRWQMNLKVAEVVPVAWVDTAGSSDRRYLQRVQRDQPGHVQGQLACGGTGACRTRTSCSRPRTRGTSSIPRAARRPPICLKR